MKFIRFAAALLVIASCSSNDGKNAQERFLYISGGNEDEIMPLIEQKEKAEMYINNYLKLITDTGPEGLPYINNQTKGWLVSRSRIMRMLSVDNAKYIHVSLFMENSGATPRQFGLIASSVDSQYRHLRIPFDSLLQIGNACPTCYSLSGDTTRASIDLFGEGVQNSQKGQATPELMIDRNEAIGKIQAFLKYNNGDKGVLGFDENGWLIDVSDLYDILRNPTVSYIHISLACKRKSVRPNRSKLTLVLSGVRNNYDFIPQAGIYESVHPCPECFDLINDESPVGAASDVLSYDATKY